MNRIRAKDMAEWWRLPQLTCIAERTPAATGNSNIATGRQEKCKRSGYHEDAQAPWIGGWEKYK